jgi:hypothetical protein
MALNVEETKFHQSLNEYKVYRQTNGIQIYCNENAVGFLLTSLTSHNCLSNAHYHLYSEHTKKKRQERTFAGKLVEFFH